MSTAKKVSKRSIVWWAAGAGVLAIGATVWGLTRSTDDSAGAGLPEELSVEAIKARINDPSANPDAFREAMRSGNLTDEQRRQLGRNMREAMQRTLRERVDEYYAAADSDRDAILDGHIDELQKRMEEWRKRREEWANRPDDGRAEEMRRQMFQHTTTKEQRKTDSEQRSPDDMARMIGYFTALRDRAKQRGIDMPGGPFGRGGGGFHGGPGAWSGRSGGGSGGRPGGPPSGARGPGGPPPGTGGRPGSGPSGSGGARGGGGRGPRP